MGIYLNDGALGSLILNTGEKKERTQKYNFGILVKEKEK